MLMYIDVHKKLYYNNKRYKYRELWGHTINFGKKEETSEKKAHLHKAAGNLKCHGAAN